MLEVKITHEAADGSCIEIVRSQPYSFDGTLADRVASFADSLCASALAQFKAAVTA